MHDRMGGGIRLFFAWSLMAALCLATWMSAPVRAQVAGASLSGTILDPSGSIVPNAQIVITDVNTGVSRTVTSSSGGLYTAPNLLPGAYTLSVTATGFSTLERTGVTLTVGAEVVLDIRLQVGQVSQTVQVTGEAMNVELASSTISAQVSATTVRELPLNGRSWTDLAALQPGVNSIETQPSFASGSDRGNREFGSQSSISARARNRITIAWTASASMTTPMARPAACWAEIWASMLFRNFPFSPAITPRSTEKLPVE